MGKGCEIIQRYTSYWNPRIAQPLFEKKKCIYTTVKLITTSVVIAKHRFIEMIVRPAEIIHHFDGTRDNHRLGIFFTRCVPSTARRFRSLLLRLLLFSLSLYSYYHYYIVFYLSPGFFVLAVHQNIITTMPKKLERYLYYYCC